MAAKSQFVEEGLAKKNQAAKNPLHINKKWETKNEDKDLFE
jgi:hypothetical protein